MKKIFLHTIFLTSLLLLCFVACSDGDDILVASDLKIQNTENGVISLVQFDATQIQVTVSPENADYSKNITYQSGNDNVFTVSSTGLITAVAPGEASLRVEVSSNPGIWAVCIIKVDKKSYPITTIKIPSDISNKFIAINSTFDLGKNITLLPENASNKEVIFISSDDMIATVDDKGIVTTKALGDINISIKSTDGSGIESIVPLRIRNTIINNIERVDWNVELSHATITDASVNGAPGCLIDGNLDGKTETCAILVKPGKSLGGVTIDKASSVYFTVDMKVKKDYNYVQLRHRTNQSSANLRMTKTDILGSDDNVTFTPILTDVFVPIAASIKTYELDLPEIVNYRYIRVVPKGWSSSGNSMQFSDFNVGEYGFEETIE